MIQEFPNAPIFSIIVPIYNVQAELADSLNSILKQSFSNFEIIAVNDGSTDNSPEILRHYAKFDSRIKIIEQENKGPGEARNSGLKVAQGEYILFLDSDDQLYSKETLQQLYSTLAGSDIELLICNILTSYADRNCEEELIPIGLPDGCFTYRELGRYFLNGELFVSACKVYRSELFKRNPKLRFPPKMIYEDLAFHVAAMLEAKTISHANFPIYRYFIGRSGSITTKKLEQKNISAIVRYLEEIAELLKKYDILKQYELEYAYLAIAHTLPYPRLMGYTVESLAPLSDYFHRYRTVLEPAVRCSSLKKADLYPYLNRDEIFFYRSFLHLSPKMQCCYYRKKAIKEYEKREALLEEIKEQFYLKYEQLHSLSIDILDTHTELYELKNSLFNEDN